MNISASSDWNADQVAAYLADSIIPMRIAVNGNRQPLLCSVWYQFDEDSGTLLAASHVSSALIKSLQKNPYCSFEIAPNDPPYMGVRGNGEVSLSKANAGSVLTELINRYLGNTDSKLAQWLLSRVDDEYVITITPTSLTAWDYSPRMT